MAPSIMKTATITTVTTSVPLARRRLAIAASAAAPAAAPPAAPPQLLCRRRGLALSRRRPNATAATATDEEGVIDPMTGEVIETSSAKNPVAGLTCDVDGVRWAYRRSEASASSSSSNPSPQVLCVHGLGSSSYSFRNVLALLGAEGFDAVAPDFPGHGDSQGARDYSPQGYVKALDAFVTAAGMRRPLCLVVQGYVTAQYALLWALEHEQDVEGLVILNTPLSTKAKLRPELAAFKPALPFLPKPSSFDAGTFAATGSPYAMAREDWEAYGRADPFAAVAATMEGMGDFGALLKRVDDGFVSWRQPSVLLFGADDPFLPLADVFTFLDSKRTCMQVATVGVKLGHMPQEDYADVVAAEVLVPFLRGTWTPNKPATPNAKQPRRL
jgi:pimeloyl-ACP methyl ester carboxylesterase